MDTVMARSDRTAEVILPCRTLDETLTFFTDRLGFRLDVIFPADDPAEVVLSGYGLRLRLSRRAVGAPGTLRLHCAEAAMPDGECILTAPNGTRIEMVRTDAALAEPPIVKSLTVHRLAGDAPWGVGRAGMLYRDLVPDRIGGSVIASHIRIPTGGPVPDYVHHHTVRFQMIYCYKGWVRVVYEDQGPDFVMRPGDCVLQPPGIRHRVLECSNRLEVIEIGCPAEHTTHVDHDLTLPTAITDPTRDFGGQHFVRHQAATADWAPWRLNGFEARDTGIGAATGGVAGVRIARRTHAAPTSHYQHDADFLFLFVLCGTFTLRTVGQPDQELVAEDCITIPAGMAHGFIACSGDLELLEVTLAAGFGTETVPGGMQG